MPFALLQTLWGKGENAGNQYIFLFPQYFLSYSSLPSDKNVEMSKLKALAGKNLNVAYWIKFCSDRAENIVGKGENACCHVTNIFFFSHNVF